MDTTTIILISLLIVVVMGFVFWYINNQAAILAEAEAEAEAAEAKAEAERLAAIAAALETSADADANVDAVTDTAPSVSTHPLAGDKYIVVKGTSTGVIVPDSNATNKFELDTTGARTSKMVITLEAVEGEAGTYYLFAKAGDGYYMKYDNSGFVTKTKKPTTLKSLKPYKIKFTSIGDEYAMSYVDKDDVQMFFGYNGDGAMKSDKSVATILTTGLVAFEDAGVSSYILTGNFGEENFTAFDIAVDDEEKPKTNIKGCLEALPDIDLGEDVDRESLLAVAYKASEPSGDTDEDGNPIMTKPCRAYPQSDTYSHDVGATGWVTTCIDETKNIEQGCLL